MKHLQHMETSAPKIATEALATLFNQLTDVQKDDCELEISRIRNFSTQCHVACLERDARKKGPDTRKKPKTEGK